jgi:beta-lactamase superfamily II metal-dependent hydrolase
MRQTLTIFFFLAAAFSLNAQSHDLEIYWTDTEGGAATLIVTPSGQSLLAHTGNAGDNDRDSKRIAKAAKLAGVTKIDYLLTSQYHADHRGRLTGPGGEDSGREILRHGESVQAGTPNGAKIWDAYKSATGAKRTAVKPGDKVPLEGAEAEIVASNGEVL